MSCHADMLWMYEGSSRADRSAVLSLVCNVQESVHDKFAEVITKEMASVTPGDGFDSDTNMGPCINKSQADWAQENVDDAVEQGAKVRHLLDSDLSCWYVPGVLIWRMYLLLVSAASRRHHRITLRDFLRLNHAS